MRAFPRIPMATRRFVLGAFVIYLFGLLGYLGAAHRHADGAGTAGAHPECQLCQASQQPFAAPEPIAYAEPPAGPAAPVEAVRSPLLASRFQPFASRAPPSA